MTKNKQKNKPYWIICILYNLIALFGISYLGHKYLVIGNFADKWYALPTSFIIFIFAIISSILIWFWLYGELK